MNTQRPNQATADWTTWTADLSGDWIQADVSIQLDAVRHRMSVDVDLFGLAEVERPDLKAELPRVSFTQYGILIEGEGYRVKSTGGVSAAKALDVASYSDWTEIPK